jgi:hydrogenase maturation factor HypF (carbamoyltransferase family)
MDCSPTKMPDDEGNQVMVSFVKCTNCQNDWWVRWTPESQPACCCYCGIKFTYYQAPDGRVIDMGGRPQ